MSKRLAIVTTHPIQYNAPLFAMLASGKQVIVKVFYTWGASVLKSKFDPGFGKKISWDIPLLEGYDFTFVNNISADPGSHHFKGINNPTLNKEIEDWEPTAVLVFGWAFKSHLQCIRHFHKRIPVLFRGDSTLLDEHKGIKKIIRRLFLKWVYRHIDFAMYVGSKNKAYFMANGVESYQLIFAPHAIDNDRFARPEVEYRDEAEVLRKKIGFKKQDLVILFAGKFELKKNPLFLIDLLKTIDDSRLKLLYVGSGELHASIKLAAAEDERIIIMDFQNQQRMPVIYRVADLFILPSKGPGETWGLALNEAMASGKAVVASTKTGGASDLIEDGINGLIIDLKNNEDLQCLLKKSLNDKQVLIEMGRQSGLKIKSFTFGRIVSAIERAML